MKSYFFASCTVLLLLLLGCGGGSGSGTVSVSVSPTSATVAPSVTQQFTATVDDTSNTAVTWEVNSVVGGSSTYGTITSAGLYTAPASVPASATVTITATAAADASKTASASVTIAMPVSVSPSSVFVAAAQTQQFTAAVTFSTNTAVTWQVNGVSGGNSTVGTIDTNGLYTAPTAVPTPNSVTITAVAKADTTRTSSASVIITPPPLVISPTGAIVSGGAQQAFTATVQSNSVSPVWSVSCTSKLSGGCGSIASNGTYTAPLAPPPGGSVTIRAAMADGSALPVTTVATIQFGNATLVGSYVFSIADDMNHAIAPQSGSITFDGAGNISAGLFDTADGGGTPITISGGTYQVGSDGRGTAVVQTTNGSFNLQFVLASHSQGFLVRTDSTSNAASGTLELQQGIASSAPMAGGSYVLSVSGFAAGTTPTPFAEAGSLITGSGAITGGIIDLNKNLVVQSNLSVSGTYTAASSAGRGTLTITTSGGSQTFAYYSIDSKRAKLVEIDGTLAGNGELFSQAPGPFTTSAFNAPFAFALNGASSGNAFAMAGAFSLNGLGSVTNQVFDGVTQSAFDFGPGAYAVTDAVTGRTTATWTANGGTKLQYVFYPRSDGGFVIMETDSVYLSSGVALPQTLSATNLPPLGTFALRMGGHELTTATTGERITGQITRLNGSTFSGTVDAFNNGTNSAGLAIQLITFNVNASSGRTVLSVPTTSGALTSGTVILYPVNDDQCFMFESDGSRLLTGTLQRQY